MSHPPRLVCQGGQQTLGGGEERGHSSAPVVTRRDPIAFLEEEGNGRRSIGGLEESEDRREEKAQTAFFLNDGGFSELFGEIVFISEYRYQLWVSAR